MSAARTFHQFSIATTRSLFKTGRKKNLQFRVRQHNRANIASNHYDAIAPRHRSLLLYDNRTNALMRGGDRNGIRHVGTANSPGHILSVHGHRILASVVDQWSAYRNLRVP